MLHFGSSKAQHADLPVQMQGAGPSGPRPPWLLRAGGNPVQLDPVEPSVAKARTVPSCSDPDGIHRRGMHFVTAWHPSSRSTQPLGGHRQSPRPSACRRQKSTSTSAKRSDHAGGLEAHGRASPAYPAPDLFPALDQVPASSSWASVATSSSKEDSGPRSAASESTEALKPRREPGLRQSASQHRWPQSTTSSPLRPQWP